MSTTLQAKDISILFIGNSMSASAGGQEELVPALLRSQGWTVKTADSYGPGMTLAGHWFNNLGQMDNWREEQIKDNLKRISESKGTDHDYEKDWENEHARRDSFTKRKGTLDKAIAEQTQWDFVILQPSGKEPTDPVYYQTHEAAALLVEKIRTHCPKTQIIFYQPWSYNFSDEQIPLYSAFRKEMTGTHHFSDFIPMIEAMCYARAEKPELTIHRNSGNVHPGVDGGYLIACLLTCGITGESPVGLPATLSVAETYDHKSTEFVVEPEDAKFLQETAWNFYQRRNEL